LERLLVLDPGCPCGIERDAEDLTELRGVVCAAAGVTRRPFDELLRRISAREPGHESRAVQVRVDLELKVDLRAFGDKSERIVKGRLILHHRAEHHLVVTALCAAKASRHPGVHEHRDALVVPARRRDTRRGEIEIGNRLGLFRDRQDLSAKEPAEQPIPPRTLVHRRHMDQLVVHDGVQSFVGRERFERETKRGNLNPDEIVRHRRRSRVPGVAQIEQQDGQVVGRIEAKQLLLKIQRVECRPRDVRNQIRLGGVDVDDAEAGRLLFGELCAGGCREGSERGKSNDENPNLDWEPHPRRGS
jgi:hypothetical protein